MQLINRNELKFGRDNVVTDVMSRILMKLLLLDRINELHSTTDGQGSLFAQNLLDNMGVTYGVECGALENIPASGGVVIVSNHPTGALDGILLLAMISRVRPDVKFMGNYLLNRIEPMKESFISVDPFDNSDPAKNLRGLKQSLQHLKSGGALVIFPAGEVATWQKGFSKIQDKQWSESVVKFIRMADVPVVPLCINAHNSKMFHLVGKIHPLLRTAMLPRELINKKGCYVGLSVGSPIITRRFKELTNSQFGDVIRANVDGLSVVSKTKHRSLMPQSTDNLMPPIPVADICAELDGAREECMLFEVGDFQIFLMPPNKIPNIIREIGRLRELTFRAVGEGSMKDCDIDHYDEYYHQLFMWDKVNNRIAGGYRMGFGEEIMVKYGLRGFYSDSLFGYAKPMEVVMSQTLELGRSFIVVDYQRKPASLMLLWKGIVYVLLKYRQYRNLLGPVTISGEYKTRAKALIVKYLQENHLNAEFAPFVSPQTGLEDIELDVDFDRIIALDSMDLINKLVLDIEGGRAGMPILIKKYLQLNSRVLAFNIDHEFCDALDALMLLDLKRVPESTIAMLSKEITEIDVIARFQQFHQNNSSSR